ncbi:hypothetical protein L1049_014335 [Liquidambar formosana]|uniref:cyclic pyranopterin monophosphate synthase n=1 Tax=Liquidambar formosana TaxID=63359 RepID=A0AAP0RQS3_LIQFO
MVFFFLCSCWTQITLRLPCFSGELHTHFLTQEDYLAVAVAVAMILQVPLQTSTRKWNQSSVNLLQLVMPVLSGNQFMAQEPKDMSPSVGENESGLTHIGNKGEVQMVDVSHKATTYRTAMASCKVILGKKVFDLVAANQMTKGDVLSVAKIAGICGAKQTSSLIPLCHNISLTHVHVNLMLNPEDFSVEIEGEAASTGETGVEMEAMTAVTVAGLTVYDMCKAASKGIQITDVQLRRKTGGKSGDWFRME